MENKDNSTEKAILIAAREVFLERGFDGTRMQEIADKANINKALLHYYFRSKERLFMAIFVEAIGQLIPKITSATEQNRSFREILSIFISSYHQLMMENPFLPLFVVREIHRMPAVMAELMKSKGFYPGLIKNIINKEVEAGNIRAIDPVQFFTSILGMTLFPFIGMPVLKSILLENDEGKWLDYLKHREAFILEFALKSLEYKS